MEKRASRQNLTFWIWPLALVIIGILLLLQNYLLLDFDIWRLWPLLLIVLGLTIILRGDLGNRAAQNFRISRGSVEAATLRASEMGCEAIFKGTKVDGVYDKDPKKHADAKRYDRVTYDEVLQKHLGVMDASAIALARDNNLPIIVFSLDEPGGFKGILSGQGTYTTVIG